MTPSLPASLFSRRAGWWLAMAILLSLRLAHINLLWSDEDYHLAAAMQMLHGRLPYVDFWYDKPPLAAVYYTLIGGQSGWPLRILDVVFIAACCGIAYRLAAGWWAEREGRAAAFYLAFFSTFYLPSATIPFAVDALLLLPHLAAIHLAKQRRPFLCGIMCAVGLLTNVKGAFVAAVCAVWLLPGWLPFTAGLTLPLALAAGLGALLGMLRDFNQQVWQWGLVYARGASVQDARTDGLRRIADWLAFHLSLAVGGLAAMRESSTPDRFLLSVWLAFSAFSLFFGNHFAPRYFLQLLPVMVVLAARGSVMLLDRYPRPAFALLIILLLPPALRFGPRYFQLLADNVKQRKTTWADAALDADSQQVSLLINQLKQPGDTLFVWGYRPDIYVYTRLEPLGKFWDSQPLDGIPADRHLHSQEAILTGDARNNRVQFAAGPKPVFVVDGLGLLNPRLTPSSFPELAEWLRDYRLVRQTRLSRIYRLNQRATAR